MENVIFSEDKNKLGTSLAVQWSGLCASTAGVWVRSLVEELKSCKPRGAAKKK